MKLVEPGIKISAADFGLTTLRKSIKTKNAEGAIINLRTVSSDLTKNNTLLAAQGLTPELSSRFTEASTSIEADNQRQYEIFSNRKNIVQNNLGLFNSLFEQLTEILRVGKILYKATDAVKTQEYTFNNLKKKVANTSRQAADIPAVTAPA